MKVAITSQGTGMQSTVDPRFGRAAFFVVADTDTGPFSAVGNDLNLNATRGAGIQAAKKVNELGVDALITGHDGPKAFATLQAGKVTIYTGAAGTVADAIKQFKAGKLKAAGSADVEGHW
jgi:predicted Fe-Mo cluster-binding NifX family protein